MCNNYNDTAMYQRRRKELDNVKFTLFAVFSSCTFFLTCSYYIGASHTVQCLVKMQWSELVPGLDHLNRTEEAKRNFKRRDKTSPESTVVERKIQINNDYNQKEEGNIQLHNHV